jgi:hypothetical protein
VLAQYIEEANVDRLGKKTAKQRRYIYGHEGASSVLLETHRESHQK